MNDRQAEICRRVTLPGYLDKIEYLTGCRPDIADLTSVQFVGQLQAELSTHLKAAPVAKVVIFFADRLSSRFLALIEDLESRNSHPVFVWIESVKDCGYAKPVRLRNFRFGFEFKHIPEGVISLITDDARNKMLMDFEADDEGREIMTIELYGQDWGNVDLKRLESPTPR